MRAAFGVTVLLSACTLAAPRQHVVPVMGLDTWTKCGELLSLTVPAAEIGLPTAGAVVTKSILVPAGRDNPFGEYCLVDGEIAALDARAQRIKFRVAMPSRWNGKLVQLGGGGFNGQVVSPLGMSVTTPPPPVARGYVVVGSDSGHASVDGTDASFASNEEQLRNFAGEQLKKTYDATRFLVKARYGSLPARRYFIGGSEGGREALTAIQHHPNDYDGIIAAAPALGFVGAMLKMQVISRSMRLAGGAGWIGPRKADLLRKTVLEGCDELDGLADNIISNVDACRVDIEQLRCAGGADTAASCFSDAQLRTLRAMHTPTPLPYTLEGATNSLPAFDIGADWGSTHLLGPSDDTLPASFAARPFFQLPDSFVRYILLRDANASSLAFDPLQPGKSLERMREVARLLDRNSVAIDTFVERGGKLILLHGRADEVIAPQATVEYYERLVARYGQSRAEAFVRFYLIPGHAHARAFSFHASGSPVFEVLEEWVERDVAPGTLTVVDANPDAGGRSRPLCMYPAWPRYNGSGDPQSASSFSCVTHR